MKWCSVTFAAVMLADCVVVWAAAVNFGQFVDDDVSWNGSMCMVSHLDDQPTAALA